MKRLLLLFSLLLIGASFASQPAAPALKAGAATSVITPPLGTSIVGGFAPFPAQHVHDELHARCLVLDDGKTKIALVVCDLLGLHRSVSVEARRLIQEATGIPPENVLISATHTHSAGTALGNSYASEQPLDEYQRFATRRIADGVQRAVNLLRPAQIAFATTEAPEHVFIRRWLMKDGTAPVNPFGKIDKVKMNPPVGSPNLIEPAGRTDPTISIIALREPGGRLISVYSAYSLHYVGGVGPAHISADYYGMYCDALTKLQSQPDDGSPPFVAIMANGTSGDANNNDYRKGRGPQKPYEQMRYVAHDVAAKVNAALANLTWKDRAELAARFRELDVRWRTIEPDLLKWAKETEARVKLAPSRDILPASYAGRVQRLALARQPSMVPVQILRIGDVCVGSSPCETFAETGLEFKQRSPIKHSFMVELAHAYLGYLPTPRHFELGGYETWPGTNYLEPQASVKVMDALVEMAREVSGK
ncbi:MAG: hypothetical protein RIQ93_1600 [Verrucomicrobiota bacterium]|jgi:hypothetical protein